MSVKSRPGALTSPVSGHMSTLRSGLAGFDFHARASGSLMIVCAGLTGLAAAPDRFNGSDARVTGVTGNYRRYRDVIHNTQVSLRDLQAAQLDRSCNAYHVPVTRILTNPRFNIVAFTEVQCLLALLRCTRAIVYHFAFKA
jgi:hypothetical protein